MTDTGFRLIKLTNGDNIIAKIKTISNNVIILENPFLYKTMSMFSPYGIKNMILFKKWFELSNESTFELAINSILSITVPNEKIISLYEKEKHRKQSPYISNDELYQNPNLMKMMEDNNPTNNTPKQVPLDENDPKQEIQAIVNFSLKLTPELLEENEALENLLRSMGVPIDELFEQMEQQQEDNEEYDEEEENVSNPVKEKDFGNDPEDWSPDPNDYLK